MTEPGSIDSVRFSDFHEVPLDAGDYLLEVVQTVKVTDASGAVTHTQLAPASVALAVEAPRFSLGPRDVRSVFPDDGARGPFTGVLPHVVLRRDTLPWERSAAADGGPAPQPPWLAVLVFTAEEWATVVVHDDLTVEDLLASSGVAYPEQVREDQQLEGDPVVVVDVPADLARAVCPRDTELRWLCHARQVTGAGASPVQEDLGVVVAPRALRSEPGGQDWVCCLVSVEDRWPSIPRRRSGTPAREVAAPDEARPVRFVALHRWRFHSTAERVDLPGAFEAMLAHDPNLRLPPVDGLEGGAAARVHQGFVPVQHHLRDGSRSGAWYRGPLVPFGAPLAAPDPLPSTRDPDELAAFDAELGMWDLTYAAAWELGRQLALADREFALRLVRWKRAHRHRIEALRQAVVHWHLPHHPDTHHPPDPAPDPEAAWLLEDSLFARLGRLQGVPWRHLVPDERLLPLARDPARPTRVGVGSFRAFVVDPLWVECLRDGAFSVGRVVAADAVADAGLRDSRAIGAAPEMVGFMVRGPVVRAWPELVCEAWGPGGPTAPDARKLAPVRVSRPAKDVLLALFQLDDASASDAARRPDVTFSVHPPPQTLHFGLDHRENRWSRVVRHPWSGAVVTESELASHSLPPGTPDPPATVEVVPRDDARMVVDVHALVDALEAALGELSTHPAPPVPGAAWTGLEPHTLALALFDPPDRVSIDLHHLTGGAA